MGAATTPDEPATAADVTVHADAGQDAPGGHDAGGAPGTPEAPGTPDAHGTPDPHGAGDAPAAGRAGGAAGPAGTGEPEPEAKGVVSAPGPEGPVRTTRRFPMFTRDTARPEGGGRAASGAAPVRQWPFLAVLGTTAFGLLLVAVDAFGIGFRLGTLLIGLALIAGAVLRRLVPSVGMLAVRSRFTDMATYGLLGTAIVLLALMAQPGPWLEIPFLESAVRFAVR